MVSLGCRSIASFVAPPIVAVSLALVLGPSELQDPAPVIRGSAPRLVFEAPETLYPVVERLRRRDPQAYARITRLVGLEDAGPPIRVIVATEDSPRARVADPWVSGYAFGEQGIVVLLPGRVPSYPYGSLEEVLDHELAHVLIARAAAGGPVPRWFNEGLAMVAGRPWNLGDRARLTLAVLGGEAVSLDRVESWFGGGAIEVRRAYAVSGAGRPGTARTDQRCRDPRWNRRGARLPDVFPPRHRLQPGRRRAGLLAPSHPVESLGARVDQLDDLVGRHHAAGLVRDPAAATAQRRDPATLGSRRRGPSGGSGRTGGRRRRPMREILPRRWSSGRAAHRTVSAGPA